MPDVGNTRARYRRILRFAARYIVQTWWYELVLPRIGLAKVAARGRAARLTRIAQRFHVLAVDLGGLMIKVGQYLSSRLDVLPPEITKELAGLQDEVPPVPFDAIRRLAEAELGLPLERAYACVRPDTAGRGIPRSSAPRAGSRRSTPPTRGSTTPSSRCSDRASRRSSTSTCRRCAASPDGSAA